MQIRLKTAARAAAACAVAALAFVALEPAPAVAAAPMVKTQAPGWYRLALGDFEVTALNDGYLDVPAEKVLQQPADKTLKALSRAWLSTPVETSVNAFLVNTGSKLMLFDTGTGGAFGPTAGRLVANLQAAGYQPEQVDDIFITHMHGDHMGGLSHDGARVFPNATVHVDKREAGYYLSQAEMDKATANDKGRFKAAMALFKPYVDAGKLSTFDTNAEIVPGVRSLETPGHTPGHSSYVVESKGQRLIVVGDLIHVAAVQLDDPTVTVAFDADPKAAAAQRRRVFDQAAKEGDLIAAAHLQFPGIGHLQAGAAHLQLPTVGHPQAIGKGWRYVPVNYTQPR
jgi:glyoxylase-like metal-dependent hydrolase (beta-lactamase superfamily II)